MKKIVSLGLSLMLIGNAAYSQFYMRAGAGYAFPQAGQTMDGTGQPYTGTVNNTTYTQAYSLKGTSFSAGVQGMIGFGYFLSDHVGVQLDGNLGLSSKQYTLNDNNIAVGGLLNNISVVQRAKTPILLIPSVVLQTGGNVWNLYSRFGIALPLKTTINEDQIYDNLPSATASNPHTIDDLNFQIKSSFSLGFTAALGVQYKVNDVFSVWGEVSLLSMSLYVKEADLKGWTENGSTVPLSYYGGPTTVSYGKNATVDTNYTTAPTYSQPFSNVGINVGISIRLSEKRSQNQDIDRGDDKNFKRKRF